MSHTKDQLSYSIKVYYTRLLDELLSYIPYSHTLRKAKMGLGIVPHKMLMTKSLPIFSKIKPVLDDKNVEELRKLDTDLYTIIEELTQYTQALSEERRVQIIDDFWNKLNVLYKYHVAYTNAV